MVCYTTPGQYAVVVAIILILSPDQNHWILDRRPFYMDDFKKNMANYGNNKKTSPVAVVLSRLQYRLYIEKRGKNPFKFVNRLGLALRSIVLALVAFLGYPGNRFTGKGSSSETVKTSVDIWEYLWTSSSVVLRTSVSTVSHALEPAGARLWRGWPSYDQIEQPHQPR